MNVQGLERVVIATTDLDSTTEQFASLLNVEFSERSEGASGNHYRYSETAGIEIITPPPEGNAVSEWVENYGTGLYAITLGVADLEAAIASLRNLEVEPISRLDTHDSIEAVYNPSVFAGVLVILRESTTDGGEEE